MAKKYAVRSGRKPGIYKSWYECEIQVKKYSGAEHESFDSFEEAIEYIEEGGIYEYNYKTRKFQKIWTGTY
nr:RNase H1/viroplasmin domain-containing protein [Sedimentibacter sp.]